MFCDTLASLHKAASGPLTPEVNVLIHSIPSLMSMVRQPPPAAPTNDETSKSLGSSGSSKEGLAPPLLGDDEAHGAELSGVTSPVARDKSKDQKSPSPPTPPPQPPISAWGSPDETVKRDQKQRGKKAAGEKLTLEEVDPDATPPRSPSKPRGRRTGTAAEMSAQEQQVTPLSKTIPRSKVRKAPSMKSPDPTHLGTPPQPPTVGDAYRGISL
jgi:hypothetical protein